MRFDFHVYHHRDSDEEILAGIRTLLRKIITMSTELQTVIDEVSELKTVNASAVSLLKKLGGLIRDNIDDKAALTQLASDLDKEGKVMADAVVENTPAEPA